MSRNKWNLESVKAEATKYKTRVEFRTNSNSAYQSAVRNGFLEEVCQNMIGRKRTTTKKKEVVAQ